ncbi:hypothetical protein QQ045_008956 [Rhodiola kirilowii]
MFRSFTTTKNRHGYNKLEDEQEQPFISNPAKLTRVYSVPASKDLQHPQYQQQKYLGGVSLKDSKQYKFGFSTKQSKSAAVTPLPSSSPAKLAKKASKIHPLFGLFDPKSKKKTITKAEFGRYLEYVKEGGLWNMNKQTV